VTDVIKFPVPEDKRKRYAVAAFCMICNSTWIGTVFGKTNILELKCPRCGECDSFASFLPDDFMKEFLDR